MKRGFFNTPRYKRAIDEAYAPAPVPEPEVARRGKPSKSPPASQDAMDVDMPGVEEVYADGHVVAVRMTRSDNGDEKVGCQGKGKEKAIDMEDDPMSHVNNGKGKEKAIETDDDDDGDDDLFVNTIPPRPTPGRRGWGRPLEEQPFHTVPRSHGGLFKERAVFRSWPRDPNGQTLMPNDELRGTLSPDGYPWGATLYDIYSVNRIPSVFNLKSYTTGSMLHQVMEAMGELDAAAPEIEWAKTEGQPRIEGAADTEELITCADTRLRVCQFFTPSSQEPLAGWTGLDGEQDEQDSENDDDDDEDDDDDDDDDDDKLPTFIPPPPTIPVTSPFHPSHYPKPWPFTPFEIFSNRFFCRSGFHCICYRKHYTSWTSRPDVIRTYNLHFSATVRSQVKAARQKAEELEEFKARTLIFLRYKRTKEQIKNHEPIIEVPLPYYQRRKTRLEESHLYLSPVAKVGKGNHSLVYKGEWELPRDLFMKERICRLCFKESMDKEIQRLKDTGRWDKMLRAASWGPAGFTGRVPTQAELDAANDPTDLARDGVIIERNITCVVPPDAIPSKILEVLEEKNVWDQFMKEKDSNAIEIHFGKDEKATDDSCVPVMRIDPPFSYESQKLSCTHAPRTLDGPTPRTAKFTVAAKLSFENDPHLVREARNYQNFPEHLFHHYDGYSIISQLKAIVPVHAVVPQFYGYYTPKRGDPGEPSYFSPILLLEHCGKPIKPKKLTIEEQEECASLVLRFHRAGWLQESLAPRNFLVQLGKPTEFPLTRMANPEPSFRLIDFGRSRKYTTASEKRGEEMEALRMFTRLGWQMGVTW
ncbi:hypothetical protein JVT61DRAFT_11766 [Boletus reticuloceps]|uniref:Protein kinase domain-containing protein n=1 Tax=Boletus reticuloceps TaxID=495285 RepID=A0A8I3AEE4_9AGAM|nr:hypothetical protein JVT61DRAFT_11766 [Boletus reticuloceps]